MRLDHAVILFNHFGQMAAGHVKLPIVYGALGGEQMNVRLGPIFRRT